MVRFGFNTWSLCLIALSFFYSDIIYAQVAYPTDSSYINQKSQSQKNNFINYNYSKIDTSILNLQNYFPINTNGNYGLSSTPLLFNYSVKKLGFNLHNAPYQNDMIDKDDVKYLQTKGPYANLTGIAGSKQEQQFKLLFSNTFKNKLNLTLAFNRYGSTGFYKRQQSFTNNFYVSSNYTNTTNRFGYYAFVLYNKVKHLENGGLKRDSDFTENIFVNKQLLSVNLNAAKREVRQTTFNFNPWFRINKKQDSTTKISHYINYEFEYNGNYSKYIDEGLAFENYYSVFYLDTVRTKDSTHWRNFNNSVNYVLAFHPIKSKLQIGFKNEINQVHQFADSVFQNNSVNAGIYRNTKSYNGSVKANYIVNGSNVNDYSFELNNEIKTTKLNQLLNNSALPFLKIAFNASTEKRHPDYIYNTWFTNNYRWTNQFKPVQKTQAQFHISTSTNNFGIGIVYQNIINQLYISETKTPSQAGVAIQNIIATVYKNWIFFKHLGFTAKYNYQTSSYQAITSLPNHVVNSSLYYQGNVKKAMLFQIGFNGTYYSGFNGMAYSPALNMYYVQTQQTVGNYPYVDFFITARIKPVRFFIKIDHVTQGLFGSNYILTPHYIQNDRAFKFGLNWLFFD